MKKAQGSNLAGMEYLLHLIFTKSPKGQLLRIQIYVLITIILLFTLFLLGTIRRFIRFKFIVRRCTRIIYILVPLSLVYTMGLMHNASTYHILYPVWACALIYAYGGVMTMKAFTAGDNDDTLSYFLRTIFLLFWTLWLAGMVCNALPHFPTMLVVTMALFLIVAAVNIWSTIEAFYLASKSKGMPGSVGPLVQYMRDNKHLPEAGGDHLPHDYRYAVWGKLKDGTADEITTKHIWQLVGEKFRAETIENERLGDICLSYAYFRLILRRFAGFPLHECSQANTRRFVELGLLKQSDFEGEQGRIVSVRAFSVIEEELSFLFDFFYTNSFVYSSYSFLHMLRHLLQAIFFAILGTFWIADLVSMTRNSTQGKNFYFRFHGHSSEVGITRIVTLIFSALEVLTFLKVFSSNRRMVWLLSTQLHHNRGISIAEKITFRVWNIKEVISRRYSCLSRPWTRKLGQYSFLKSYKKTPFSARRFLTPLGRLVKRSRAGEHGKLPFVDLSTYVKQAVLKSLLRHVKEVALPLSPGTATLTLYGLTSYIATTRSRQTDAHVILVWHIATSLCEKNYATPDTNDTSHEHFLVATQLSNYCAYLVCFVPELLADHPYTTECAFDKAVAQARQQGIEMKTNTEASDSTNVVFASVKLANKLVIDVMPKPELGWKVLAEFWAELLLYLAPSDNMDAHGEYLARGGEFITHVWALLTHAGIIERTQTHQP